MAVSAKWRNLLVLWLVFAVSPFSMCAQTVCEFSCSFHEATVPDSWLHSPKGHGALIGSAEPSAGMHCHKLSDSAGAHSGAFVGGNGVCQGNGCVSKEFAAAPATAQSKLSNAPAREIRIEAPSAIAHATTAVGERHRSCNSCIRFPEILASGTLRI